MEADLSRPAVASRPAASRQAVTRGAMPENYVRTEPTTVLTFATPADWTVSNGAKSADATKVKNASTALKIVPSASACTALYAKGIGTLSLSFAPDAVIGVWVYLENLPASGASIALRVGNTYASGTFFTDNKFYSFDQNYIRNGWNYLAIRTDEDGTTTQKFNTWTSNGAGCNFANAVVRVEITCGAMVGATVYLDSITFGGRSRPKLLLGMDFISEDFMDNDFPYMDDRGITGYLAITLEFLPSPTVEGWLQTCYDAGWDIINHTEAHTSLTSLSTAAQIRAAVDPVDEFFDSKGWTRGRNFFVYPENSTNDLAKATLAETGRVWARGFRNRNMPLSSHGIDNPLEIGCTDYDNRTLAQVKNTVLAAVKYGTTVNLFGHDLVDTYTGDLFTWARSDFQALIDYVVTLRQQGQLDVVTPSEWYSGLTAPRPAA